MLAQNFKSADQLGISHAQMDALRKTLVLLETGKLAHAPEDLDDDVRERSERRFSGLFNMNSWAGKHPCGTVCCIGGTAELIGNVQFGRGDWGSGLENAGLEALFYPPHIRWHNWQHIIPAQAATALRSYLTTGDARWDLAVA